MNTKWFAIACAASLLVLSMPASAAIYRMGGTGIIYEYETLADLAIDNQTQLGQISSYANDGWFVWDQTIYRTGGSGNLYGYATFSDFLTNTQIGGSALATHGNYGGDEWFVYDNGSGDRIYRLTDGGNFIEYNDIAAVMGNTGTTLYQHAHGLEDDGAFALDGSIYLVTEGGFTNVASGGPASTTNASASSIVNFLGAGRAPDAGEVLEFSFAGLTEGAPQNFDSATHRFLTAGDIDYGYLVNHTLISDINSYANDGWFVFNEAQEVVPAPAAAALFAVGGLGLFRRQRSHFRGSRCVSCASGHP